MASEHIEEVGLRFKADGSADYIGTLKQINNEMSLTYAEYVRDTAEMDKNATATEKLKAKKKMLESQMDSQRQKVAVLRQQVEEMSKSEDANTDALQKKQKELAYAESKLTSYGKSIEDVNDELSKHTELTDKMSSKLGEVGGKVENYGKKASVVSGGIVAIGTASIAAFNEVDEGLDIIVKKTGATGEAMNGLEQSFKNVFGSIPTTADKAGIAIGEVNTKFGATGEMLEELSRLFIQFAEINDADLNSSIDSTSHLMQQWNLDISQTPNLLGLISSEAQRTGIATNTLMASLEKNGSTFKELGLSIDQSIVLLANFEMAGVDTGTALAALRKSASAYTAEGKTMQQGFSETVAAIKNAKTETEALSIAQSTFGTKGALEMATAIREGRLSVDDLVSGMENMGNVVADTFEATLDAPDKLTVAMNNTKIAGADLGATILDMVSPMLSQFAALAQQAAVWIGNLDEGTKQTIVTVAAIAAAIGPLLIVLGKVISSVGSLIGAVPQIISGFSKVGSAFSGFVGLIAAHPIVAAIAAVIAIIATLWTKCEWFRNLVKSLFEWLMSMTSKASGWVVSAFQTISDALTALHKSVSSTVDKMTTVFKTIVEFLKNAFVQGWTAAFKTIGGTAEALFSTLSSVWTNIKAIFTGIIDFIKNVFTGNWRAAWQNVVDVFGNVFSMIGNLVKAPINAVITLLNSAIDGINAIAIEMPNWVPGVGGRRLGFNIPNIPMLASGGELISGMAIVAEAGPELVAQVGGRTVVTPLSGTSKNSGQISLSDETIERLASMIAQLLAAMNISINIGEREFARIIREVMA